MELEEVVMKLVGPVMPAGDSTIDAVRVRNLDTLCDLAGELVDTIAAVAKLPGDHRASVIKSKAMAADFLAIVRDTVNDAIGASSGTPAKLLTDEQIETLIENSDGHWKEDVFCIGGPELMRLMRAAASSAAPPESADGGDAQLTNQKSLLDEAWAVIDALMRVSDSRIDRNGEFFAAAQWRIKARGYKPLAEPMEILAEVAARQRAENPVLAGLNLAAAPVHQPQGTEEGGK